ncbi:MAG: hypothetical protein ACYDDO_01370 [Acidiferrobacterales bacterium]
MVDCQSWFLPCVSTLTIHTGNGNPREDRCIPTLQDFGGINDTRSFPVAATRLLKPKLESRRKKEAKLSQYLWKNQAACGKQLAWTSHAGLDGESK